MLPKVMRTSGATRMHSCERERLTFCDSGFLPLSAECIYWPSTASLMKRPSKSPASRCDLKILIVFSSRLNRSFAGSLRARRYERARRSNLNTMRSVTLANALRTLGKKVRDCPSLSLRNRNLLTPQQYSTPCPATSASF